MADVSGKNLLIMASRTVRRIGLNEKVLETLEWITHQVNAEYGIDQGIPIINHGPCGVFAQIFLRPGMISSMRRFTFVL
jgi:hypothetical protein